MKYFIDHDLDKSGKGKFLNRLVPALDKLGAKLVDFKHADLVLGVNKFRTKVSKDKKRKIKYKKKKVLRLDGLHFSKTNRDMWANNVIRQDTERADALIFQSDFCRGMWKGIMGVKCKREYIIFNGANPADYTESIESPHAHNVIMCADWRKRLYKRFKDSLKVAEMCATKDIGFWIAGADNKVDNPNVHCLGYIEEGELRKYLKMADVILCVSHHSWCDNAFVEGICAGCFPIVGNQGGNTEIARKCGGAIMNIDKLVPAKRIPLKPPPIDRDLVVSTVQGFFKFTPPKINIEPIHIDTIAKQYKKVFDEVVNA